MKSDNEGVQKFRAKLSLYLGECVVPGLKQKKQEVIAIDQDVFNRLSVGPRLTHSLEAVAHAIGDYARDILYHVHGQYTEVMVNPKKMTVTFRCVELADPTKMDHWEPLVVEEV